MAGARCKTCSNRDRPRIELALASGLSIRGTAERFGIPYHALRRHWIGHVPAGRKAMLLAGPLKLSELVDKAADEGKSVLDHLHVLRAMIYDSLCAAHEAGDRHSIAALSGRAIEILRETGKITGELVRAGGGVHIGQANFIFSSPEFIRLQSALLGILREHPEARTSVIKALRDLERGADVSQGTALVVPAEVMRAAG